MGFGVWGMTGWSGCGDSRPAPRVWPSPLGLPFTLLCSFFSPEKGNRDTEPALGPIPEQKETLLHLATLLTMRELPQARQPV